MSRMFALALGLSAVLFSGALCRASDNGAAPPRFERDLERTIKSKAEEIEYFSKRIDFRMEKLESMLRTLQAEADSSDARFHKLYFVFIFTLYNPYENGLVYREIDGLMRSLKGRLDEVDDLRRMFDRGMMSLNVLSDELATMSRTDKGAELKDAAGEIEKSMQKLRRKLEKSQESMSAALRSAGTVYSRLEADKKKIDQEYKEKTERILMNRARPVWSADLWEGFGLALRKWVCNIPSILMQKTPDTPGEWACLLGFMALPAAVLFFFARRLILRRMEALAPDRGRSGTLFVKAFGGLLFGLVLLSSGVVVEFPRSMVFYILGGVGVILFQLNVAWGLKKALSDGGGCVKSPLTPLFWLYFAGICFGALNADYVILLVFWMLATAAAMFFMAVSLRRHSHPLLERIVLWATIGLEVVFLVLMASGRLFLAVGLNLAWLMLCIGVIFCVAVSTLLSRYFEGRPRTTKTLVARSVVMNVGMPVLCSFVIFGVLYWVTSQCGKSEMILLLLRKTLSFKGISLDIGSVCVAVLGFFFFRAASEIMHVALSKFSESKRYERSLIPSLTTLASYGLWTLYLIFLFKTLGISIASLLVVLGGVSVGIGFGLQNIVNNFLSGIIILFERTVHPGDIVQIGDVWATVLKIHVRTTLVRSFENAIISIPNSEIVTSRIINWTQNDLRIRKDITVGAAYGSDLEKVRETLLAAAAVAPHVERRPEPPAVFITDFGPSSLNFVLRVWIDDINHNLSTQTMLREEICRRFKEAGIAMMDPPPMAPCGLPRK